MVRSAKVSRSMTFRQSVKIQVAQPEFEPFASLRHLDLASLRDAARGEIELGYVKAEDCRQLVRAVFQKGMVTAVQVEPCGVDQAAHMSPELVRLLNAARRHVVSGQRTVPLPISVREFFTGTNIIDIDQLPCYVMTVFGIRMLCCQDQNGKWTCSTRGVILQPAPKV